MNNQRTYSMERLLRKLLAYPNRPAVVLMQAMPQGLKAFKLPFFWSGEAAESCLRPC